MPEAVLHQIKYLCKNIVKEEWSGVLFYTCEGSIRDLSTFKIILQDILPMDMGTSVYTSYDLDERFISYLEEDFDTRATWKVGHIHSHNVMRVFFSGTDMQELHDNAPNHNFYLSLIVNNYMDFTAKVAFVGESRRDIKKVPCVALDEKGNTYTIQSSDYVVDDTKLFTLECDIISPAEVITVSDTFKAQTVEIMKPKPKPIAKLTVPAAATGKGWNRYRDQIQAPFPPKKYPHLPEPALFDEPSDLEEFEDMSEAAEVSYLAMKLFAITELTIEDTLETVLSQLEVLNPSSFEVSSHLMKNYATEFSKVFPKASSIEFMQLSYDVIDELEDYTGQYPLIKDAVEALTKMIENFISHEQQSTSKI